MSGRSLGAFIQKNKAPSQSMQVLDRRTSEDMSLTSAWAAGHQGKVLISVWNVLLHSKYLNRWEGERVNMSLWPTGLAVIYKVPLFHNQVIHEVITG